jgi:hypothetical protein
LIFNLCSSRGEEDDEKKKKNPTTPNGKTQYTKDCEGETSFTTTYAINAFHH